MRETTARSRYHGLLTAFRQKAAVSAPLTLNYTLSRSQTDATNDRDAIDIPQNPLRSGARLRRRAHRSPAYLHRLVHLRAAVLQDTPTRSREAISSGWQVAGIVTINSGQPVPRVSVSTNNFRRGGFADFGRRYPGRDTVHR